MRQSGILLHITSLPSRGGVGTLGKAAYEFIDFIKDSGMTVWQMLPIGPTGFAESPYQSTSTYAGNPLVIDFETLEEDGLLPPGAWKPLARRTTVNFEAVKKQSRRLLKLSFEQNFERLRDEIAAFEKKHRWVRDYALFCAVKAFFGERSWMEWPDENIRLRKPATVGKYKKLLAKEIDYYVYEQYVFFMQWAKLRAYARAAGVKLMGDIPIYVAEDSADVWRNPGMFELDADYRPVRVAGVPPDYFSAEGQRWGNPLYAWDRQEQTGFSWWLGRLRAIAELFDIVRIDHFIGFANYYAIPASEPTALVGKYEPGPGRKLFDVIKKKLPRLEIVAEDLGVVNQTVLDLLAYCGYPGMKVMQFAFDGEDSAHLPVHHAKNCFVYTGTHDNNTTRGWWDGAPWETKERARRELGMKPGSDRIVPALTKAAFASVADTVILPMQDVLGLGGECRMNTPGTVGCNWTWRMPKTDYAKIAAKIRRLNEKSGRGKN